MVFMDENKDSCRCTWNPKGESSPVRPDKTHQVLVRKDDEIEPISEDKMAEDITKVVYIFSPRGCCKWSTEAGTCVQWLLSVSLSPSPSLWAWLRCQQVSYLQSVVGEQQSVLYSAAAHCMYKSPTSS